jgi:hypothetical protein
MLSAAKTPAVRATTVLRSEMDLIDATQRFRLDS